MSVPTSCIACGPSDVGHELANFLASTCVGLEVGGRYTLLLVQPYPKLANRPRFQHFIHDTGLKLKPP